MKKTITFFMIISSILIYACGYSIKSGDEDNKRVQEDSESNVMTGNEVIKDNIQTDPGNLLTLADAQSILGEPTHLSDSSSTMKNNNSTYYCCYTANAKEIKTGKTGNVYFLFEQYAQDSSAKQKYSFIKTANGNHEGIKVLDDLGDEAYFHSDGENFYFIMVRKGAKVFNMKVNKITGSTSLDEFKLTAKKIADAI